MQEDIGQKGPIFDVDLAPPLIIPVEETQMEQHTLWRVPFIDADMSSDADFRRPVDQDRQARLAQSEREEEYR